MKKTLILLLGVALGATFARAEDDANAKAGKAREARRAEMIKKYDKNGDGTLDEAEKAAMQEDFKKKRDQERLKKYDKNGDGQLDDAEKEAMREDMKKQRELRKAERAEKAPVAPAVPATPAVPPAQPK